MKLVTYAQQMRLSLLSFILAFSGIIILDFITLPIHYTHFKGVVCYELKATRESSWTEIYREISPSQAIYS